GNHKIKQVVINMIMMRCRSGHKLFAIPQIACATIATATIFSPCTMPSEINVLSEVIPNANKINAIADGIVNPNQAANAPKYLAFDNPSAIPTWLLAGPGKNWHNATKSAYSSSLNHRLLCTNSSRKYPKCAIGPPNEIKPNFKKIKNIFQADILIGNGTPIDKKLL